MNILVKKIIEVQPVGTDSGIIVWQYISPVGDLGIMSQGDLPVNNSVFWSKFYSSDYPVFIIKF